MNCAVVASAALPAQSLHTKILTAVGKIFFYPYVKKRHFFLIFFIGRI